VRGESLKHTRGRRGENHDPQTRESQDKRDAGGLGLEGVAKSGRRPLALEPGRAGVRALGASLSSGDKNHQARTLGLGRARAVWCVVYPLPRGDRALWRLLAFVAVVV
jgi:hypothetical protein